MIRDDTSSVEICQTTNERAGSRLLVRVLNNNDSLSRLRQGR